MERPLMTHKQLEVTRHVIGTCMWSGRGINRWSGIINIECFYERHVINGRYQNEKI